MLGTAWVGIFALMSPHSPPSYYAAKVTVVSSWSSDYYQGAKAMNRYWHVLDVIVNNTGKVVLSPRASDWWMLAETPGAPYAWLNSAASAFYQRITVNPGQSAPVTLAFDIDDHFGFPASHVTLLFPDGSAVLVRA